MQVKALQNEAEIARFVEIIRESGATSFLEIGSKFGGSLWRVANAMPVGSRIVAVDMPNGTRVWPESKRSLESVISELRKRGYDARIIWGDSTDPAVVRQVKDCGEFDAVFLDGNHTMPFVRKDWANYCQTARIVGFHDIAWRRDKGAPIYSWIDVPEFWAEIKSGFRHEEISLEATDNGIGVIWR